MKDTLEDIKEKKKAQHQTGFKPATEFCSAGVCTTAVLQPLPKGPDLNIIQVDLSLEFQF